MSLTPTQRLRLAKQATGDNPNAWGIFLNAVLDLIDEAFGVSVITVAADVSLSSNNYSSDQARRMVLRFTGVGGFNIILPQVEKAYLIDNRCTNPLTFKTALDAGIVARAGVIQWVYCDGTTVSGDVSISAGAAADSARLSAQQAAASAAAAALFDPSSYYTKTVSDARYALAANAITPGQINGRIIALAGA